MTSGIIEILKVDSGVQAAVGLDKRGRTKVYPTQFPQDEEQPYIVVSEVSLNPSNGKACPSDLDGPRYTVDAYSLDFRKTEQIQEACRLALDTGDGFTTAVANFDEIWMVDRKDLWMPGTGQDRGMYVKSGLYEARVRRTP